MRRIAGSHEPNNRNRSSKHLNMLIGQKPIYRSMSGAALAACKDPAARKEEARRKRKHKTAENM